MPDSKTGRSDSSDREASAPHLAKRYEGKRSDGQVSVTMNREALDPRFDLCSHSPDGFEWGYAGSGPAQLALALLTDCLDDEQEALKWYQDFKSAVVAGLPREGWVLTDEEIRDTITAFENE